MAKCIAPKFYFLTEESLSASNLYLLLGGHHSPTTYVIEPSEVFEIC